MVDLRLTAIPRAGEVHHGRATKGVSIWIIGSCCHHTLLQGKNKNILSVMLLVYNDDTCSCMSVEDYANTQKHAIFANTHHVLEHVSKGTHSTKWEHHGLEGIPQRQLLPGMTHTLHTHTHTHTTYT